MLKHGTKLPKPKRGFHKRHQSEKLIQKPSSYFLPKKYFGINDQGGNYNIYKSKKSRHFYNKSHLISTKTNKKTKMNSSNDRDIPYLQLDKTMPHLSYGGMVQGSELEHFNKSKPNAEIPMKIVRPFVNSDHFNPMKEENMKDPLALAKRIVQNFRFDQKMDKIRKHMEQKKRLQNRRVDNDGDDDDSSSIFVMPKQKLSVIMKEDGADIERKQKKFFAIVKRELDCYLRLHKVVVDTKLSATLDSNSQNFKPMMPHIPSKVSCKGKGHQPGEPCFHLLRFYRRIAWIYLQISREKGIPLPMKTVNFKDSLEVITKGRKKTLFEE